MLEHATNQGLLVVPVHKGRQLRTGLVAKTLKDAGLTGDELERLL